MERAIYCNGSKTLEKLLNEGFARLYFASEFCGRLLLSPEKLKSFIRIGRERAPSLTLATAAGRAISLRFRPEQ